MLVLISSDLLFAATTNEWKELVLSLALIPVPDLALAHALSFSLAIKYGRCYMELKLKT